MFPEYVSSLRRLRSEHTDSLLTLLAGVLILMIFIIAPLQAVGIYAFHLFAICLLLAIIGGMVIISNSPTALILMSIALVANLAVFFLRLYYPVPYHLHILAGAWLIIAGTLGIVVTQAVFRQGRVTYHRIIGAILLYLLIAMAFAALFAIRRLVISGRDQGDTIRRRSVTRQRAVLSELCHPDIDWLWRYRSNASAGAKSMQH